MSNDCSLSLICQSRLTLTTISDRFATIRVPRRVDSCWYCLEIITQPNFLYLCRGESLDVYEDNRNAKHDPRLYALSYSKYDQRLSLHTKKEDIFKHFCEVLSNGLYQYAHVPH
jgi:hypothetical protein